MTLVLRLGWLEVGQGRFMLMVMLTSVSLFWVTQFNSLQQLSSIVLPIFYMGQYYGKHYMWDNNLNQEIHSRILGEFSLKKTRTKLRVGYDVLKNYTYFGIQNDRIQSGDNYLVQHNNLNVRQSSSPINLLTLQLQQDFRWVSSTGKMY